MAIRKITEVNMLRLKKTFEKELKDRGHDLTSLDIYGDDITTTCEFVIDNFYRHKHTWASHGILGKEFKEVVDEVLQAFNHEKHVARNGRRID